MIFKLFTLRVKITIIPSLDVLIIKTNRRKIMFEEIKKVLVDSINVDEDEIKPEAKLNDDSGIDEFAS